MLAIEQLEAMMRTLLLSKDFAFAVGRVPTELDREALSELAQSELLGSELLQFQNIRATKRRAEFYAGRIVARKALSKWLPAALCSRCEIGRSRSGAPSALRLSLSEEPLEVPGPSGLRPIPEMVYPTISHAQGYAVAVIAPVRVGVDLERIEVRPGALSSYFLSDRERMVWERQPTFAQPWIMNALWTRKEAASKVGGWGGSLAFSELDCLPSVIQICDKRVALRTVQGTGYVVSVGFEVSLTSLDSECSPWNGWLSLGGQSRRPEPFVAHQGAVGLHHG